MDFDLNKFAYVLGDQESGNNYENKDNPIAYGRYQFTVPRLNTLMDNYSLPAWYNEDYFDSHHALQDLYFSYHVQDILNFVDTENLTRFIGIEKTSKGTKHTGKINIYGLVAGAHLGGNGGLNNYLLGRHDAFDGNKYVSDYVVDFSNIMSSNTTPEPVPAALNTLLPVLLFGGLIITGIILHETNG